MNRIPIIRALRLVNMLLLLLIKFLKHTMKEHQVGVPVVREESCQVISPPFGRWVPPVVINLPLARYSVFLT
jgi:hypothetical protein